MTYIDAVHGPIPGCSISAAIASASLIAAELTERQPSLNDRSTEFVTIPRFLSGQSQRAKLLGPGVE